MYQNSKRSIYTPLILVIGIVIGLFIGYFMTKPSKGRNFINSSLNKIDTMLEIIEASYVDKISKELLIEQTIPALLQNLDPHSVYIPPELASESDDPLEGSFQGIGIQFNIIEDTIMIIGIIQGGPSQIKGIRPGDRIIKVNETTVAGKSLDNEKVYALLKGIKGSHVKLEIHRQGIPELLKFDIIRDEIPLHSIQAAFMIKDNIGFIRLNTFSITTIDEFRKSVKMLKEKGMRKLILDLRENTGGYLESAVDLADEFFEDGKLIVYTQGNARPKTEYFSTAGGICLNIKLSVIIDSWSASASEIFAGAIQDHDLGTIIGQRSFGKGLVQQSLQQSDNSLIRLTIARYYTPSGRCIQKPYGNEDAYDEEIDQRIKNGELSNKENIKFPDSLKFKTDNGRIVYGGGGIMPDVFVPSDSLSYSSDFLEILKSGIINQFVFSFIDQKRIFLSQFKDVYSLNRYLDSQPIIQNFNSFREERNKKTEANLTQYHFKIIETQIKALIARSLLDDNAYFIVGQKNDKTLLKAIEVISQ